MGQEAGPAQSSEHYRRAPTLSSPRVLFARVAGFTFEFHSIAQSQACLAFYAARIHPSGRSEARATAVREGEVTWRWEVERWHARLPLYLREEPRRVRVVAALTAALRVTEREQFE
jgi:hypothetical protein